MSFKRSRATYEAEHQAPHAPYALYGSPLPPFEPHARDDSSFVPVWKQEVTDERGRKRLHGAFTGGFSAGYFNTVGSKEGWTPSTFVSSRANRTKDAQKPIQQRPEDFMDDEDRADAAEAQKLETQNTFAALGSTEQDVGRRGVLTDLFEVSGDTMGVKLLQRMGWRQGQGVGPKVRRKARAGDVDDEHQDMHLFAPDDSPMVSFVRKNDRFGLGHSREERLASSTSVSSVPQVTNADQDEDELHFLRHRKTGNTKAKKLARKGGFGLGVLNDTGSDDEDPYEIGPKISYNRTIGGDKKQKKTMGLTPISTNPKLQRGAVPLFASRKTNSKSSVGFRKCHDGRLPLDGFLLSTVAPVPSQDNKYAAPQLPEGWVSVRQATLQKPTKPTAAYQSVNDAAKASSMDPAERAQLLGESQLPGKSVFDFMSAAARDRLATVSGKSNLPTARGEAPPEGYRTSEADKRRNLWDLVPRLDKDTAFAALNRGIGGFMPYSEDEGKRARYRVFLELRSGLKDELPERARGATDTEWAKELQEFAHAAEVFKPMTGLMASRFTSSSAPKIASDAPQRADGSTPPAGLSKPIAKPEDPAEAAAKIGMYGPMTRSQLVFYPTRLLCKRFNVKPPAHVTVDPGSAPGGDAAQSSDSKRLEIVSKSAMDEMLREAAALRPGSFATASDVPTVESVPPAKIDVERNEALEGQRAGEAVFKAIFGSDEEDE
ncbi:hypothetical protein LTR50_000139 [Elasticomyces elasticus]|nr:hypothetical protein LTR50_000139 [Elasticomyces elasticus]